MSLLTRAEYQAARERAERKPIFTGTFWADLGERVVTSAAGGALAVASTGDFALTSPESWQAFAVGAGVAALLSLLKGIVASAGGTGSASLAPKV
ncbi:holin [Microbacterium phage phiMiGM15]